MSEALRDPSWPTRVEIYDTTLRDGSQREGISLTVADKLKVAEQLIESLSIKFDPDSYHDEYRDCLMKVIDAKAAGKTPDLKPAKARETCARALASRCPSAAVRSRPTRTPLRK